MHPPIACISCTSLVRRSHPPIKTSWAFFEIVHFGLHLCRPLGLATVKAWMLFFTSSSFLFRVCVLSLSPVLTLVSRDAMTKSGHPFPWQDKQAPAYDRALPGGDWWALDRRRQPLSLRLPSFPFRFFLIWPDKPPTHTNHPPLFPIQ